MFRAPQTSRKVPLMRIDLNSDLGEGFGAWRMGDDAAMLGIVSSANVACGFHAGDPAGILETLRLAKARDVTVGAQVVYHELSGMPRRNNRCLSADLVADVIYQIGALGKRWRPRLTAVQYVKPHGALYNTIAHDERQASDVITAVLALDPRLCPGRTCRIAAAGLGPVPRLASRRRGLRRPCLPPLTER
jgi:UPF0271 protein